MEDRIRALEKGITQESRTTTDEHFQRTEENLLVKVRDIMTSQIIPQALHAFVEPRIREISSAQEVTGRRVDQLAEVAARHTTLLQESSDSIGHIKDMFHTAVSKDDMKTMMSSAQEDMRALMASSQIDMKSMMEVLLSTSRSKRRGKTKANSSQESSNQGSSDDSEEVAPQKTPIKKTRKENQEKKIPTTSSQPTIPFTALPSKITKNRTATTAAQEPDTIYTVSDQRERERYQDEPAIEELKRIWPKLRATAPVSGDKEGHTFGNALRTTSTYKTATSSKEVTKSLLAELTTHKGLYKTTYILQRCTSEGAGDAYMRDTRDLSSTLNDEILQIISDIEAQTNAMPVPKSKVFADHFLFHALMEKARRPVAQIVTTSEGVTYLHEMHAIAIRQEGTFDKDIIVVHLDERTIKYRVLLEQKRTSSTPLDRDGMSDTLILPSMKRMYGEDHVTPAHKRRIDIDDTKYQVQVSSPGGMEVTVDGIPLDGYSPLTITHVLTEINHQGAAGGGHTQISLRSHDASHNA
jgi:hypothetical protein